MLLMSGRNNATFTLALVIFVVALSGGIYSFTRQDWIFGVLGLVVTFGMRVLVAWPQVAGGKNS